MTSTHGPPHALQPNEVVFPHYPRQSDVTAHGPQATKRSCHSGPHSATPTRRP
eukprot:gene26903-biopygen17485